METEYLNNKLEYLKGGLILIEKELKKLRIKFLKLQFTPTNIKRYRKVKSDYILVNNMIKNIEEAITE